MGTSKIARCGACRYESDELLTGGGLVSFRTYDARPVHCGRCKEVTTANFKAQPLICERCSSAHVVPLVGEGPLACPKCGKIELRLSDGEILWD